MLKISIDNDYHDLCEIADLVVMQGFTVTKYYVENCSDTTTHYVENTISKEGWYVCAQHKEMLKREGFAQ